MQTTLGGDRLGSGNKQKVSMRNYERSTHNLSYIWRSTMASGTLVPFMTEVGLPGDTFDIDLNINGMTHPTIGPLFGSYKMQLDIFQIPIRLYNAELHQNKLGIGMKMQNVYLPQILLEAQGDRHVNIGDNEQINPSCIFSYLNIRGLGMAIDGDDPTVTRSFNAIPYLAYWEIYKNYYANKQEEIGYVIHNPMLENVNEMLSMTINNNGVTIPVPESGSPTSTFTAQPNMYIDCVFDKNVEPTPESITAQVETIPITMHPTMFYDYEWFPETKTMRYSGIKDDYRLEIIDMGTWVFDGEVVPPLEAGIQLYEFPLSNIDDMREYILQAPNGTPLIINDAEKTPYNLPMTEGDIIIPNNQAYSKLSSQEGLGIKTYQSDLFNNWISTEWIDGDNGINAITSIDTSDGNFTIDTLNLSNKVYNMLNRIAISGGTYDDWLDAVYTHERAKSTESPVYMGSLIRELAFEEVVSNSATEEQPLGTLAGRGQMTGKKKGGRIRIKIDEPSYIMGIVSLTPRIDYSQGNKWDVNLKTMDDFHKPALDEIGFQDLITDQMAWFDTKITAENEPIYKSAGKQPAWINYMTNVNQVRGNFAESTEQMWMTLNRKYEQGDDGIEDLTTYVDPMKYNHIFADTRLDAQNFWIQISADITARRKMSAKIIPNL